MTHRQGETWTYINYPGIRHASPLHVGKVTRRPLVLELLPWMQFQTSRAEHPGAMLESIKELIARHIGLAHAQTGIHNMQKAWKMEFFAFRDGPE